MHDRLNRVLIDWYSDLIKCTQKYHQYLGIFSEYYALRASFQRYIHHSLGSWINYWWKYWECNYVIVYRVNSILWIRMLSVRTYHVNTALTNINTICVFIYIFIHLVLARLWKYSKEIENFHVARFWIQFTELRFKLNKRRLIKYR